MSDKPLHVFACFGALPFEASLAIFAELRRQDPSSEAAFLLTFDADDAQIPSGVQVFRLVPAMQTFSRWEKPFKVAAWFHGVHRQLLASERPLHAYVPHPAELPSNHFVFHKRPGDRVELLPDGLLNYVDASLAPERVSGWPRYLTRVVLELMAAKLYGFSYVPLWSGHQTQFERGLYDACWTYRADGYLTISGEVKRVPDGTGLAAAPTREREEGVVLYLDQELHGIVSAELESELRVQSLGVLSEPGVRRVLYKAHPRGRNRAHELSGRGFPVEDVTGHAAAEALIRARGVSRVVGFYSTTLLLASPEEVRERVAVLPEVKRTGVRRPDLVAQAARAFARSGVRIVWSSASPSSGEGA